MLYSFYIKTLQRFVMQTQIQMADTVIRLIFTVQLHVMIHHP